MKLLIQPPIEFFTKRNTGYFDSFLEEVKKNNPGYAGPKKVNEENKRSYSAYNYYPGGITSGIKTHHFEKVLQTTRTQFGKAKILDMGCADGFFLPSLSKYFPEVVCADIEPEHCQSTQWLRDRINAENTSVVCTAGPGLNEMCERYKQHFDLIVLLEVMEHVGDPANLYPSKTAFLQKISEMLAPKGKIIVTVPVMTGVRFLLQRSGLGILGMYREPLTWKELLNAGLFAKTENLEKRWWPQSHLGFNHHKLGKYLAESFTILEQKHLLFQEMFILQLK